MNFEKLAKKELLHQISILKKNLEIYQLQESLSKDEYYKQHEIRRDDNFWKNIINRIPMVVLINGISELLWVNDYCEHLSGCNAQEWINFTPEQRASMFHPEDMKNLWELSAKLVELKTEPDKYLGMEYRIKTKNGEWKWVYGTWNYLFDSTNNEFKVISTVIDIQNFKDKEAEIARLNSEKEAQHLLEKKLMSESVSYHQKVNEFQAKELNIVVIQLQTSQNILRTLKEHAKKCMHSNSQQLKQLVAQMIDNIEHTLNDEVSLKTFDIRFDENYPNFKENMLAKYPDLTSRELELCKLIKINLSSKISSSILNLSERTIESHRRSIRKKMNLGSTEQISKYL